MRTIEDCRADIETALSYGGNTHAFEDVVDRVEKNLAQFWPLPNSVVVSEILDYPQKRTFHVWLVAGNLDELYVAYPMIEQWAKERGCVAASMTGRPGWSRTFLTREQGWHKVPIETLEKDFTEALSSASSTLEGHES